MADNSFIKMCIQYAKKRGGGMPLTAQEFCNAVYLYAKNELRFTNEELNELAGKINPAVELVNQLNIKVEELNTEVETYSAGIEQAQRTAEQAASKADGALSNSVNANATANTANTNANTALSNASKAQTTAEQAASKADGALSNSVNANATANQALTKVNTIVIPTVSEGTGISITNESGDYTVSIDVVDLAEIIKGSDSVIIDLNEAQTALEVHLEADLVNKMQRALTLPSSAPAKDSVVVVTTGNAQTLKPLSDIGSKIYKHKITFTINKKIGNFLYSDGVSTFVEAYIYDGSSVPKQQSWLAGYISTNMLTGYLTVPGTSEVDTYEAFGIGLFRTSTGSNIIITSFGRNIGGSMWQSYAVITDNITNFTDTVTEL